MQKTWNNSKWQSFTCHLLVLFCLCWLLAVITGYTVVVLLISVTHTSNGQINRDHHHRWLNNVTSTGSTTCRKACTNMCAHTYNGTVCLKIDGYSTRQFSRGVKQQQLLSYSLKDGDSTSIRELCGQERKKKKTFIFRECITIVRETR